MISGLTESILGGRKRGSGGEQFIATCLNPTGIIHIVAYRVTVVCTLQKFFVAGELFIYSTGLQRGRCGSNM